LEPFFKQLYALNCIGEYRRADGAIKQLFRRRQSIGGSRFFIVHYLPDRLDGLAYVFRLDGFPEFRTALRCFCRRRISRPAAIAQRKAAVRRPAV
jgi:hypothetical protein